LCGGAARAAAPGCSLIDPITTADAAVVADARVVIDAPIVFDAPVVVDARLAPDAPEPVDAPPPADAPPPVDAVVVDGCIPMPELCNAVDDNCSGSIDEGFPVSGGCSAGIGPCRREGVLVCTDDGLATECTAVAGTPLPEEICNGVDDNCNGPIDEGLGLGMPCSVGIGICARSGFIGCDAIGLGTSCDVVPGDPGLVDECGNLLDDDCDGMTDEGFDVGAPCTVGVGACARIGAKVCTADRLGTECAALPGDPAPAELCGNLIDDDCDIFIDEGFDVGAGCSAGVGACTRPGFKICTADRATTECNAVAGAPAAELCGNGLDENCDGVPDDGFDVGAGCSPGVGQCKRDGHKRCTADGTTTEWRRGRRQRHRRDLRQRPRRELRRHPRRRLRRRRRLQRRRRPVQARRPQGLRPRRHHHPVRRGRRQRRRRDLR
jgi:hypothetical protein